MTDYPIAPADERYRVVGMSAEERAQHVAEHGESTPQHPVHADPMAPTYSPPVGLSKQVLSQLHGRGVLHGYRGIGDAARDAARTAHENDER